MRSLARFGALMAFCASLAACTLNWDPLQPPLCGGAGQACCANSSVPCVSGLACVSGTCPAPCATPSISCAGACIDVSSSVMNCGSCGHACTAGQFCSAGVCSTTCSSGQTVCSGGCVDLMTSATSCGACGNSCESTIPHAGATCSGGTCHFASCATGFGDCDGNPSNGCETNLQATPTHCGSCATNCPSTATNEIATCAVGVCGMSCALGFSDCNAMAADGCETQTATDPMHCGTCATVCAGGANATAGCAAGVCTLVCAANFADCDHLATNGCEVDLQTDARNCGACGTRCMGMRMCVAGICA